jgi:hypothetical protein
MVETHGVDLTISDCGAASIYGERRAVHKAGPVFRQENDGLFYFVCRSWTAR